MPLQAYKNDPKLREDFIAEMRRHQEMDQIIKGTYGEGSSGDFKGCHIGCAVHSLAHIRGTRLKTDRHQSLEDYLDIPVELAYLFDGIFEGLPEEQAKAFPLACSEAIRCGADLKMVVPQFLFWLLADPTDGVIRFVQDPKFSQQKTAIEAVADLHRRTIAGERISSSAVDAARGAARDAARAAAWDAAADAARAAADAARDAAAWGAAWGAAWDAARAAAWDAARAAAWDAARIRQAEKLIELLKAA